MKIIRDFSVHAELVEAFLWLFQQNHLHAFTARPSPQSHSCGCASRKRVSFSRYSHYFLPSYSIRLKGVCTARAVGNTRIISVAYDFTRSLGTIWTNRSLCCEASKCQPAHEGPGEAIEPTSSHLSQTLPSTVGSIRHSDLRRTRRFRLPR